MSTIDLTTRVPVPGALSAATSGTGHHTTPSAGAGRKDPSHLPDPGDLPLHIRNVATLRGLGFSYRVIGRHYGVTPQAISVLLSRQKDLLGKRAHHSELAGLSPRAVTSLGRLGIRTRLQAQNHPDLEKALRGRRNCGQKTIDEILSWAGQASSLGHND
jgi:hypothetical protein